MKIGYRENMKTAEMENFLDDMTKELFGRGRKVAMDNQLGVICVKLVRTKLLLDIRQKLWYNLRTL